MTIDKWRESKSLTRWWFNVLRTEEGKAFLEMMEESHIRHIHGRGLDAGVELGQIQGYDIAMNNVLKAGELKGGIVDPGEPTYEKEEEETPRRKKAK